MNLSSRFGHLVTCGAVQAGVMVGDLKAHWDTYYAHVDEDDDADSDGSPW